ncbi:MAG: polysaccharide biosynthesis tyrosine autokinase [Acidobacteriota bacterium]
MADDNELTEKLTRRAIPNEQNSLTNPMFGEIQTSHDRGEEEEQDINLREGWHKVWRRKWLVLMIVLVATSFTAVEAFRKKSIYEATATVEIGKEGQSLTKLNDVLVVNDDTELKTGLFILQSRPLLEDVVVSLKLDQNPKFLDITQRRSIGEIISGSKGIVSKEQAAKEDEASQEVAGKAADKPEKRTNRSPEESARLAPFVSILRSNLITEPVKETRLVKISVTHSDPAISARIANGIANVFIESSFRKNTDKYIHTSDWLSNATRKLQAQVEEADKELADYSRNNGIFTTEGKESLTTSKLAQFHDQLVRAETERMLKQSLYDQVIQGRVAQLPEAFSNVTTTALQQRLADLTIQVAQASTKYGAKNPHVIDLREQMTAVQQEINNTRGILEEKLKADYERAMRDEQSLTSALDKTKSEAVQQNQTAIQYGILKQRAETTKLLYNDFLQKTSQADVQMAQIYRTVSIAEPAGVPAWPVGPMRFRSILLALILSLAASLGLVFLLNHLDNTIKNVEDVARYARVPTLGVIPAINASVQVLMPVKKEGVSLNGHAHNSQLNGHAHNSNSKSRVMNKELISELNSHSPILEAYRMLRTSILLSGMGRPPKTILVTSSLAGEGKTTTTVNTAIMLSQLGSKVLIIDADMRRPRVHKQFGLNSSPGLSNYLSSEIELDTIIRPSTIKNLSLLCAGLIPPNSAELLSSEKMTHLLQLLSERFDHILVDSPPVNSVTDPVILSRLVEGVILVIHGGKSKREVVSHARQELSGVGAKIFGVVLNNVDVRDGGYYNYYYYRHRYGYSYGKDSNGSNGSNGSNDLMEDMVVDAKSNTVAHQSARIDGE